MSGPLIDNNHTPRLGQPVPRWSWEELRNLTRQPLAPQEFFAAFLERLASLLGFVAAAVWLRSQEEEAPEVLCQHSANRLAGLNETATWKRQRRLMERFAATGQAGLLPPGAALRDDAEARNHSEFPLLLAPLKDRERTVGVVAVLLPLGKPQIVQQGCLTMLARACDATGDYFREQKLRELEQGQALGNRLDGFYDRVHASLCPTQTAYTIANEGRGILECDRLSVVLCRGGKCRVEAVSGQDVLDRRGDVVRKLERLVTCVVKTGEPLWFHGDRAELAPQLEAVLDAYLDASNCRLVGVLPLAREQSEDKEQKDKNGRLKACPTGALIIEQFQQTQLEPGPRRRLDAVQRTATRALANALEHEGFFLAPLLRRVGRLGLLRRRPWFKIAMAAVAAAALALTFIPAELKLEGRGTLEPVGRHDVFAATDGVVRKVNVEHGKIVAAQQVLVELQNTDVEMKLAELQSQLNAASLQFKDVQHRLLNSRDLEPAERDRLRGDWAQLTESLASLKTQLELYQRKAEQLQVRSPVAGQVVTWDVENLLKHRPVERGQMLLSVADVDGQWELEIHMPEDRLGHVISAQAASGEKLPVSFILATEPGVTRHGTLSEVHQRAEVRGEEGNVVLVRVAIDKRELSQLRRGAGVVAKVHCGQRSLGYVWFHDLVEFVQSRILFRL